MYVLNKLVLHATCRTHAHTHPLMHILSHRTQVRDNNKIQFGSVGHPQCVPPKQPVPHPQSTQKQKTKKQKKLNAKAVRLWHLKSSNGSVHRMSVFLVSQPGRLSFHATFVSQSQMALIQISQKANNKFKNMS